MSAARKILAATGQATHPGVVTAHDIVVAGKYAAFVSPWIEGPTLRQTMSALPSRFFEVDMFRQWLGGLLVALESAHQQGLVHGALDPDLVLQHGRDVYVVGFGINAWLRRAAVGHCRRAALDKASGYLSPAQSRGDVPRPDDDIYALGALIYEVLTGTPPQSSRWWQRRGLPVEMTRQRRRNGANGSDVIPETWERAVARCLEPLERDRIGSVR